ncbi:hypothetical protein DFQ26_001451 [Actinomortierella ambigua]|nr:hypothetical protein DFQ26_001451 [Actinomortierella ambigua]
MADELGFQGLTAWFAPEYESRYSSVWVPQQSPVSTEMSCDDESLVPFVSSQVSEKLERLEDYCARLCGLDLSTKNQLETALAEARTGFTLVDLFDDARRWDVRRNED